MMKTIIYISLLVVLVNCSNNKERTEEKSENVDNSHETGKAENIKSGLEMVFVKGGDFIMGGNDDIDDGGPSHLRIADECPHSVTITDFFMAKYEITQANWFEIMGTNPNYSEACDACPVSWVSWEDIQEFIKKLNLKYDEQYRLPTEEEWEFAARGGLESENYTYAGSNNAVEVAWFIDNSLGNLHPVGMLKSNEIGIHDMSGNIWEWCSNVKLPYPCDEIGKAFNSAVLRGGSYAHRTGSVRVRDRNGRGKQLRLHTLGFRLAK